MTPKEKYIQAKLGEYWQKMFQAPLHTTVRLAFKAGFEAGEWWQKNAATILFQEPTETPENDLD